jgi:hypothetical protein
MTSRHALTLVVALAASRARAQPVTQPGELPPLAQIRDDKQLGEALSAITQDPSIHVDDPAARGLAQALMTEGVRQLQNRAFDQALANFLEAYNKFPHPKILLDVASTLREMGRLADAANTYQRYIADPATSAERVGEVKELLHRLDEQLTLLTVRVFPRGSDVSIDGGPFVAVGSSLQTRIRPGIHLVRVRKDSGSSEITINGFENEAKEISAAVKVEVTPDIEPPKPPKPDPGTPPKPGTPPPQTTGSREPPKTSLGAGLPIDSTMPEHVDGWLITGTQYGADSATGRARRVRTGFTGPEVAPIVPKYETTDSGEVIVHYDHGSHIASGAIALVRFDASIGHGTGLAGGLGIALAGDHFEVELAALRSNDWGAYVGARYRFFTGAFRPYIGVGVPLFAYSQIDASTMKSSSNVAVGLRAAGGLELYINGHLSVLGDVGYEHFFNAGAHFTDYFAPTVGVIGRL